MSSFLRDKNLRNELFYFLKYVLYHLTAKKHTISLFSLFYLSTLVGYNYK